MQHILPPYATVWVSERSRAFYSEYIRAKIVQTIDRVGADDLATLCHMLPVYREVAVSLSMLLQLDGIIGRSLSVPSLV
jgi:hypothetical protein